ncbi:transporter, partial [bacterium]
MIKKSFVSAAFAAVAALCVGASPAGASGFALIEQSVSGLGNSFAGGAAGAQDASTIFYNPAGMALLKGEQAILGLHYIRPQASFTDDGTTTEPGGRPLGSNSGDAGVGKLVPNLYYANNKGSFAWGLGVMVPFGLATKYDEDWKGRYHGVESDMQTVNFNPAVAYK